jgi:Fe-S cluster assembly protein SufB
MAKEEIDILEEITSSEYKYGFESHFETDEVPAGLNEDVIRQISAKKDEPEWMLEWRLSAYRTWLGMQEPEWANVDYKKLTTKQSNIIQLQNKRKLLIHWMRLIQNYVVLSKN